MSSNLTVRVDRNVSVLQRFVSEGENYLRLQRFIDGKDLGLNRELQDKLSLGFWDRFVIIILNIFSPELSAKKVASFVKGYMSKLQEASAIPRVIQESGDRKEAPRNISLERATIASRKARVKRGIPGVSRRCENRFSNHERYTRMAENLKNFGLSQYAYLFI